MTLLAGMEANVRTDLKDLDAGAYLWQTAEVDRHLAHAVSDYQRVCPRVRSSEWAAVADGNGSTRRQALSPLPVGYLYALRFEWPVDGDPVQYRLFLENPQGSGAVYLYGSDFPAVGESIRLWWTGAHELSNLVSTIPLEHEEVICLGAVAYAAEAAARYTATRLNASYWTPRSLAAFARERMMAYQVELARVGVSWTGGGMVRPTWAEA